MRIDLRPVWELAAPNLLNFIGGGYGVTCPNCAVQLQIREWRPLLAALGIFGAAIATLVAAARLMPPAMVEREWLVALILLVALALLACIQRSTVAPLATLRKAEPDERLIVPLEWDTRPISKLYLSEGAPTRKVGPNWKCHSCGEQSPGQFEVCWKCQKERRRAGA